LEPEENEKGPFSLRDPDTWPKWLYNTTIVVGVIFVISFWGVVLSWLNRALA